MPTSTSTSRRPHGQRRRPATSTTAPTTIANFLGGTADRRPSKRLLRRRRPLSASATPMIRSVRPGRRRHRPVNTEVEFAVNGTVIDPGRHGVQLGGDLPGTHNKTIFVFGFGVHVPFKTRFFGDIGYRYGQILANTDNFETDNRSPPSASLRRRHEVLSRRPSPCSDGDGALRHLLSEEGFHASTTHLRGRAGCLHRHLRLRSARARQLHPDQRRTRRAASSPFTAVRTKT